MWSGQFRTLQECRVRLFLALLTFVSVLTVAFGGQPTVARAVEGAPSFAANSFLANWQRSDLPISQGRSNRSWYWGPTPFSVGIMETYADSPNKKRQVQYFDKARMEINNPSTNNVSNGLLVVEMISGRRQEGDRVFVNGSAYAGAIAGDAANTWPTYAGLANAYLRAKDVTIGQPVQYKWTPTGAVAQEGYRSDPNSMIAIKQNGLGIPAAFWNFLNRQGLIYVNGGYTEGVVSDWLFSSGLPITEAYWTRVLVGGVAKDVLFQAFERRTLTYTPSNTDAYKVEMGNVGMHYVKWRYPKGVPQVIDPLGEIFVNAEGDWYEVTGDVLNVRTAPNSSAPRPIRTDTKPYIDQLVKGNRVQPIAVVEGEAIEAGNSDWFQIYKNPSLYVYSGFVSKITMPAYPPVPRTHAGLWVSVNLTSQMMAVYENNRILYSTYISSGVPSTDPEKDFRTPEGVFKIIGSYRPQSQTMEGGEGDKATGGSYYKIEEVRNVSYFYQDFSIHGTYWHARFGTFPQSHGCVNATVFDASLIYQLKANTTVDVFRELAAEPRS